MHSDMMVFWPIWIAEQTAVGHVWEGYRYGSHKQKRQARDVQQHGIVVVGETKEAKREREGDVSDYSTHANIVSAIFCVSSRPLDKYSCRGPALSQMNGKSVTLIT